MARIPEGEIERLKREVSIERLAEARGVELKRHGADLIGLCPFHEDHSPSLVISPQKNLWNCLGACGKGGSVIDWVMRAEGISFRHAVELLRQESSSFSRLSRSEAAEKVSTVPKLPAPAEPRGRRRRVALEGLALLSRDAEADAGGAAVSRQARPAILGDGGAVPAGLRQSHARIPSAGIEPQRRRRAARTVEAASASCARRAGTSTSTARW